MMTYSLNTTDKFDKQLRKLDKQTQRLILKWINKNLVDTKDPRQHGKQLVANHKDKWRYRIGDYRMLANIQDDKLIIIALEVGHRKDIYG